MANDSEYLKKLLKSTIAISTAGHSLSKSPSEKAPAPAEGQKEQSTRPAEQGQSKSHAAGA